MGNFAILDENDRYEVSHILFIKGASNLAFEYYKPKVLIDDVVYSIQMIMASNKQNKIYFECINTTSSIDIRVIDLMGAKIIGGTKALYAALFLEVNFIKLDDEARVISNKIYNNYFKIVSLSNGTTNNLVEIIPLLDKAKELAKEKDAFSRKLFKLFEPLINVNGGSIRTDDDCCEIDNYLLDGDYNEGVFAFDEVVVNKNEIIVVDNSSAYESKLSDLHLKDQLKLFMFFHKVVYKSMSRV